MKKILNIIICGFLITSSFIISLVNVGLVKSGTTPQITDTQLLNYIWNKTKVISNVTYSAYQPGDIARGRSFASNGGTQADNILLTELRDNISLNLVHNEQLQHINGNPLDFYSDIINVTDYDLTINGNDPYPYPRTIPKNEMFCCQVTPMISKWNFSFNNVQIVPYDFTSDFPLGGTLNDYHFIVNNYQLLSNNNDLIVGNVSYLTTNDPLPSLENQTGRIFILDDIVSSQSKIDNLTNADAIIIIGSGTRGLQNVSVSQYQNPAISINISSANTVIELIQNYTTVIADNYGNNRNNLTFSYNIDTNSLSDCEYILLDRIPNHYELWDNHNPFLENITNQSHYDKPNIATYLGCINYKLSHFFSWTPFCKGIILYDSQDCHYMISIPRLLKPVFTVNNSVGGFLATHHETSTVSGYSNQTHLRENALNPVGGIGYNVMGNLTIEKSPGDAIAIVSNRYDGMWGQTPGDSGVGTAIVLGIAKYFKDESITPKYNLTFLFTTAEEYGLRGMKYFNDSHENYNIKYWFILDQLAFNQQDCALCLHTNCSADQNKATINRAIVQAIVNDTNYRTRTGYDNITTADCGRGSEQKITNYGNREDFCLVKDQDYRWDNWHRTGADFIKGDCLDNTDRNDVNVTTELFWRILEYYLVNPNCYFSSLSYEAVCPTGGSAMQGTIPSTLKATFTIKSSLPCDPIMVNASLYDDSTGLCVSYALLNYTVNRDGVERNVTLAMPAGVQEGDYYIILKVYNSTARINRDVGIEYTANDTAISPTFHLNRYHTLGDIRIGTENANAHNIIRGSKFTATEPALVHNITAYVYGISQYPPAEPTYQCMIYRISDGRLIGSTNQVACYGIGWLTFTFA